MPRVGRDSTRMGPRWEPGSPKSLFQLLHLPGAETKAHCSYLYQDFFPNQYPGLAQKLPFKEIISRAPATTGALTLHSRVSFPGTICTHPGLELPRAGSTSLTPHPFAV